MAKLPITHKIPWKLQDIEKGDPKELADYMKSLIRSLRDMYADISRVVNLNAIEFTTDSSFPISEGQLLVWRNEDAGPGEPTHYLAYKTRDGETVTFPSNETA